MSFVHRFWPPLALATVLLAAATGCHSLGNPGDLTSDSLLKAAKPSPDAVTLDIYWARTSVDDQAFAAELWQSVEEDRLPVEVRRSLAEYGLRAGVVGGSPSAELMQLLNPNGQAPASSQLASLSSAPPKVTKRMKQIGLGQRLELQATDSPREFTLLENQDHQLTGRQFPDAQGIYGLKAVSRTSDRVQVELLPELHHGQPRMQIRPSGPGMVVQQFARDFEGFDDLRLSVDLAPGEILVITCLPESAHRLGGLFHHTEVESYVEQKYLLVRLAHVPEPANLAAEKNSYWPWK
ncbi:hypothetical protein [Aeoliella mucimassa]|uniref:Uncharacterized protein n=1 Tax=Aeoliella mucimassa TaxID=2527972 RepID=A0A518AU18_9BACT|nr:hypothetical protein [Aeoliella mucimassa]QDU58222.1 hypothetical protein Pan181_44550 [Aeoliella mucimassa]